VVGAEVYAPLAPVLELSLGAFPGIAQCTSIRAATDRAGQAASSACRHHRPVWEPARSKSVRAAWNSREVSVAVRFARFGRPHSWRIACSGSNGRRPAGLPARPAAFTTDGADAHPSRTVSPTALEELGPRGTDV